jgi:hydroxyethylthiazole kinase-like uncharacterized protein yjeF
MRIFSAAQIKQWDAFTIANEPVTSINLMERAATKCYQWIMEQNYSQKHFLVFCGKGNNGGDGLAIARMLLQDGRTVTIYILEFGSIGSADFQANLAQLHEYTSDIHFIQSPDFFPVINKDHIIIDALFGTGLNKPLHGISAALVDHLNHSQKEIIAIDLPSGLSVDAASTNNTVIKATHTLSFQHYRLAFLLPENAMSCGAIHLLDISLDKQFEKANESAFELTDRQLITSIYKPRTPFVHKGNFGHAALICGSYGMMGAAVLSANACLRSGVGKLTCYVPKAGYEIIQTAVPEAMCIVTGEEYILSAAGIEKFDAAGIGPGIGRHNSHTDLLKSIFNNNNKPFLVDADALNTIGGDKSILAFLPKNSILTPHPKEFERLFGPVSNDFERVQLALQKSKEYSVYIILKGHYSFISTPEGKGFFNSTGNAGMATAGSGDVLSGIITGLLAQHYPPLHACLLGAFLHGLAGDIAAEKLSQEAMIAGDIIHYLGEAFKTLL